MLLYSLNPIKANTHKRQAKSPCPVCVIQHCHKQRALRRSSAAFTALWGWHPPNPADSVRDTVLPTLSSVDLIKLKGPLRPHARARDVDVAITPTANHGAQA